MDFLESLARTQAPQGRTWLLEHSFQHHLAPDLFSWLLLWLKLSGSTLPDFSPLRASLWSVVGLQGQKEAASLLVCSRLMLTV